MYIIFSAKNGPLTIYLDFKDQNSLGVGGYGYLGNIGGGGSENEWHASNPTKFFVEGPLFIEVMVFFFNCT